MNVKQIPSEITAALDPIKDNEEAVKQYGIHLGTEMCKKILATGIKTLHLYTLNMDKSAIGILMVISMSEFLFFCSGLLLTTILSPPESWIN